MKNFKFILFALLIGLLFATFQVNSHYSLDKVTHQEIAAIPDLPVNYACFCERELEGCYVNAGIQLYCPNGAQAFARVMPDGNWCYPNTRSGSCRILCLSRCIEP